MMKHNRAILLITFVLAAVTCSGNHAWSSEEKGRKYYEARGEVVWEVPTTKKVICLTFDDGPDPVYTPQILQLLKEYQARVTFFVTGKRVERYPKVAEQQVKEGHELANHSYSHPNVKKLTPGILEEEITKTQNIIHQVTGQAPKLFRPPGGYYDEALVNTAKKNGYTVIMWSWHQDTRDWSNPGVNKIVKKVLNNTRNGDIVLFHDHGGNREQTINALKEILPELQKRGYQCITVSDLLQIKYNKVHRLHLGTKGR